MEPIDPFLFGTSQPCFGCGPEHPTGLRLRFHRDGDEVLTRFTPTDRHQGPPGIMHGGLVATVADEVASWTLKVVLTRLGFTARLKGRLQRAVRTGVEFECRGNVDVRVVQAGETCFAGQFAMAVMDLEAAEKLVGGPVPDAWRRFLAPQ
jgi:acyl-coenzyme A thioesterase PaaI-like protein